MNKLKTLALLGLLWAINTKAQWWVTGYTESQELQTKYWTYRENLRKYLTVIDDKPGGGLPFSDLTPNSHLYNDVVNIDNNNNVSLNNNAGIVTNLNGKINVGGDVTAYMAEYMGVLASEYWLLHNGGMASSQEENAVLNEIYFALYAMERLDKYANKYYNPTQAPDTDADGFFVREDAPLNIFDKLTNSGGYPQVKWMSAIGAQGLPLNNAKSLATGLNIADAIDEVTGNPVYIKLKKDKKDIYGNYRPSPSRCFSP